VSEHTANRAKKTPNNEQQQKHSRRRSDAAGTTATELERDLGKLEVKDSFR